MYGNSLRVTHLCLRKRERKIVACVMRVDIGSTCKLLPLTILYSIHTIITVSILTPRTQTQSKYLQGISFEAVTALQINSHKNNKANDKAMWKKKTLTII